MDRPHASTTGRTVARQASESTFFRSLNAPYVLTPFIKNDPGRPLPDIPTPQVSENRRPLELPVFQASNDWEWLNSLIIYDIHEETVLCENESYTTTLRTCRAGDRGFAYINKCWNLDQASPGIMTELYLYKTQLKHLMGIVVPKLISVRSSAKRLHLGIELPHNTFFIEASADMPETLKRRVVKALEKIHANDVWHGHVNLSSILIGGDGKVYFCDFHDARSRTPNKDVWLEKADAEAFRMEMRKLKYKLDHQNAREKEKNKLVDSLERERRNRLEQRKALQDPSYEPQLEPEPEDDKLNRPLDLQLYGSWLTELDRQPRRYIMPGQFLEDFEWELKRFYNILRKMEENDIAEGLMTRPRSITPLALPLAAAEGPSGQKSPRFVKQEDSAEMLVKQEPSSPPLPRYNLRKRKRTTEPVPSSPAPSKRPCQCLIFEASRVSTSTTVKWKNDGAKPGFKFVEHSKMHSSIQENNVMPSCPFVAVRDFAYERRLPSTIRKRRRDDGDGSMESERDSKRIKLDSEGGWSFWKSWNPLRYIFPSNDMQQPSLPRDTIGPSFLSSVSGAQVQVHRYPNNIAVITAPGMPGMYMQVRMEQSPSIQAQSMISSPLRSLAHMLSGIIRPTP